MGQPVSRARLTASFTQSRIGPSLTRAEAPNIARVDRVLNQNIARAVGDSDLAGSRNFKSRVVGAILFGFLSHQTDIRHRAHGGRVEGAIFATVANGFFRKLRRNSDPGSRPSYRAAPSSGPPHFTRLTNSGGHRSIDDHIAGYVQVGNAAAKSPPWPGQDLPSGRASRSALIKALWSAGRLLILS